MLRGNYRQKKTPLISKPCALPGNTFQNLNHKEIIKEVEPKLKYTPWGYPPGKAKMRPPASSLDHESTGLRLTVFLSYANFLLLYDIIPTRLMGKRGRNGGERRKVYSLV
jgi:hypothetical protein